MTTTIFYPNNDANLSLDAVGSRNGTPAGSDRGGTDAYIQSNINTGSILTERYAANIDTSAITSGATLSSATYNLYGFGTSGTTDTYNVTQGSFNNPIVLSDFANFTDTKFSTSDIAIGSWNTSGYNTFTANASGLAMISKNGTTKLWVRNSNKDIANSSPTAYTYVAFYMIAKTGTSNDPYLSVTYTVSTDYPITLAQGSFTYTGYAAILTSTRKLIAAFGSYTYTGFAIGLSLGKGIVLATGSYALTGFSVTLTSTRRIALVAGSYALTGYDVVLKAGKGMIMATGSYVLTGFSIIMRASNIWTDLTKSATSFVNSIKNSSVWTDQDKH